MPHLNRAVDDPLLPSDNYKAYPYLVPVNRETDLAKTLDINKLHFSLDDFQKLSTGTYNAGEFRITDSGKLDIVNNHKTWTIFNNKPVDATDSYAIRVAFAKAMAAGGLDSKAMKPIRQALGLGPGYTLRSGKAMKPLTRQEVREIIDANIATLNAKRSPNNQLQTYAQLHAGYSPKEKRDIAATREEINRTGSAPTVRIPAELSDVNDLTQMNPSFEGLSVAKAEYYLEFIDELSTALECLLDQDARYDWVRENHTEYKVTVLGGADGMAIALENGHVVFETVADGKRSRIDFGHTPERLRERLDRSQALLNKIAVLAVDDSVVHDKNDIGGDDRSEDDVSQKPVSKKSNPSGNIRNEFPIEDNGDRLSDLSQSNIIPPKITRNNTSRKASVSPERIEVEEEPSPEARKLNARKNLDLLAALIANQYSLGQDVVTEILKQIEGWEEKLAECSTEGHPTQLGDINDDLRQFLVDNMTTIQSRIDKARADQEA